MKLNENISPYNIVISFYDSPIYEFGNFAKGYHNCAKELSKIFFSKNGFRDYDGYPIVFLYRHAFELYLKNIIYWGVRLTKFKNEKVIITKLYNHHNLKELAKLSNQILKYLFKEDKEINKFINKLRIIVDEFINLDNNSYSYRYPIDSKGNYSTNKHQIINLTSFSNTMDKILNNLDAINFGIEIETDDVNRMITEILENYSNN